MQTRQQKHNRRPQPDRLIIIVSLAAVIVIALVVGYAFGQNSAPADPEVVVSTESASSVSASRATETTTSAGVSTSSATGSSSRQSTSGVVTDYAALAQDFGGVYGGDTGGYDLDFEAGTFRSTYAQVDEHYVITQVLRHPDASIVVNLKGTVDGAPRYLSLLIQKANATVTQNWQTGTAMADHSDTSTRRLAMARSADGGKTFDMSPAYTAFAENRDAPQGDQDASATLFTPAN